jgi:hypothetical protein
MDDICNFKTCNQKATVGGYIYGHIQGEEGGQANDRMIIVWACAKHAKRSDFFPMEQCKSEN